MLGIMWFVELINGLFFGHMLNQFGILPRRVDHLLGIWFSPFLHRDLMHLTMNSLPFLFFGLVIALRGKKYFFLSVFSLLRRVAGRFGSLDVPPITLVPVALFSVI